MFFIAKAMYKQRLLWKDQITVAVYIELLFGFLNWFALDRCSRFKMHLNLDIDTSKVSGLDGYQDISKFTVLNRGNT